MASPSDNSLVTVRVPGRVNLIGDHTDYNDGFVMPIAIEQSVTVTAQPRLDRTISVSSAAFPGGSFEFNCDSPGNAEDSGDLPWHRYPIGVATMLVERGIELRGADLSIAGDLLAGAGLASSAAIEIAIGIALTTIAESPLDP